jgi:hypothetical protein
MQGTKTINLRHWLQAIDWQVLVFLLLFLNVKMVVKITAVVLLLFLNKKMLLDKSIYRQKIILFYFSMIAIGAVNFLINISSFSANYFIASAIGIFFWLLCIIAAFFSSWFVKTIDTGKLHTTISLFFLLNALLTFIQLLIIMQDAGVINPFTYQGMHQKYFMGTGDNLAGISFDTSSSNALINAFGMVYSLKRSKFLLSLVCMSAMLLTASNITNLLLIAALFFLFIFQSSRPEKSMIIVCLFMLLVFLAKISPQNAHYITAYYKKTFKIRSTVTPSVDDKINLKDKPDDLLNEEEKKQKLAVLYLDSAYANRLINDKIEITEAKFTNEKPIIPKPSIHTEPFQRKKDTTVLQRRSLEFAVTKKVDFDTNLQVAKNQKVPGKLIALQQSIHFLKLHPSKLFMGDGMGNFSSKLAFRATGLGVAGGYPASYTYINDDFKNNHLNLYLYYFSKDREIHSLINAPDSVYDQLLAEYGLAGILSFAFLYIGFFIKRLRHLTYAVPLLIIFLGALATAYWFEQLSIVVLFELLLLLDIKTNRLKEEAEI